MSEGRDAAKRPALTVRPIDDLYVRITSPAALRGKYIEFPNSVRKDINFALAWQDDFRLHSSIPKKGRAT